MDRNNAYFTHCNSSIRYVAERGSFMDEKLKRIEAELKKLGINTVDDLNKAIKNQEKLDLSLMVSQLPEKERIAG